MSCESATYYYTTVHNYYGRTKINYYILSWKKNTMNLNNVM